MSGDLTSRGTLEDTNMQRSFFCVYLRVLLRFFCVAFSKYPCCVPLAPGLEDKAVLLYQRGGNLAKAIMLCVKGKLFEVLTQIADDLDADADPEVFARCEAHTMAGSCWVGKFYLSSLLIILLFNSF